MILNVPKQIREWMTVSEFLEEAPKSLDLNTQKVLRWCREKRLPSKDIRRKGAGKADWRISVKGAEKAIQNLLAGLTVDA